MLDTIQAILWSITYILIIIAGYKSRSIKKVSMPYIAGVLNFSWELCALIDSGGLWIHTLWLGLDCGIVYFGFRYLKSAKNKVLYAVMLLISTFVIGAIFRLEQGMLISVFTIDFIMAICFLMEIDNLSPMLKVPIAVTKLLGDLVAGLYYAPMSGTVARIAALVFFCNVLYLYLCISASKKMKIK